MTYPFTLHETNLMIEYLNSNPQDAITLSNHCFTMLEEDKDVMEIDLDFTIPHFPKEEINISKKQLNIRRSDIRDFFIVYKVIEELEGLEESIERLWQINHKSKNKGRVKNDKQHLLLLYSKHYRRDITFAFEKDSEIFWQIYNAFTSTMNLLEFSVEDFINHLSLIYNEAHNDGAFGILLKKLIEFSKVAPKFYDKVFDKIIRSKEQEKLFFAGVLAEGIAKINREEKYYKVGKELISKENIEQIWSGLDILGGLQYSKTHEVEEVTLQVFGLTSHSEGNIRFKATSTLLRLILQNSKAQDFINQLSIETDDNIIQPIVDFIWRNWETKLNEEWFQKTIHNIFQNPILNQNSIGLLKSFFNELYEKGEKEFCLNLIEKWLKNGQDIEDFKSCFEEFAEIDLDFLTNKYTYWLASGNQKILRSLLSLSSLNYRKNLCLDISVLNEFDKDKIKQVVAAIIGFVFMKESLAKLLLSILDSKHINWLGDELKEVFVGYVCYTYPSTLDELIKPEIARSKGKKKTLLEEVVNEVDEYFNNIKNLGVLKEFSGSDVRRENYNKAFDKVQQDSYKKADEKSIFSQLSNKILLRTGPVWFCKIDGEYQRESEMSKISSSFELPRAESIDPTSFEYYRIKMRLLAIQR